MTLPAILFLLFFGAALFGLPRRWAALPLLAGACYMTLGQAIEFGPFNFYVVRLLLLVGFIRVLVRRERPAGGLAGMDWLMILWGGWALAASAFHAEFSSALVNRLGMTYNTLGVYFLIRCFCQDHEDVVRLIKMTAILLVPVALEMALEHLTQHNLFAALGGVPAEPEIRNGRLRAQGPFAHSILAGTVGAVCAPLMVGLWRRHSWVAKMGLAACLLMVFASASSGPLMSVIFGAVALLFWRWRRYTRQLGIAAVIGYILLDLVMKAPAYYLIARVDLVGGSTGYHRARLIQAAAENLNEWWFAGTDYTRHWMPYGVPWSEDHADITNHYLAQGVRGGLPLMLLFILILWAGFRYVGQALRLNQEALGQDQFLPWTLGASLLAHAATCTSVAYFDQSFLFLYSALAMAGSLRQAAQPSVESLVPLDSAPAESDEGSSQPDPATPPDQSVRAWSAPASGAA